MPISFVQLHQVEPSPAARRLLWHVLSIGCVWRDEPEAHPALDKAGVFLCRVVSCRGAAHWCCRAGAGNCARDRVAGWWTWGSGGLIGLRLASGW
ncbi:MAG: hypothetical protein NT105_04185 [Verrucomicrobia bacterium]|nr:hypothetical protein [Verrucomicrobiota bacterium]